MTKMLQLPAALEAAGLNVRVLEGWDHPDDGDYYYREEPNADTAESDPAGVMHHHTAGGHYTPNREKANGFAGLSYQGSETLYQERYNEGRYDPVITIANAYPAPISSGAGDYSVLERVRGGIEVVGRQGPDTPDWYGNTHYCNFEWVCKGDGSPVDPATFEMMLVVCDVMNDMYQWNPNHHIGHGHHTGRKIDLWDGTYGGTAHTGFDLTIEALREQMGTGMWANDWTDKSWMTFFDDTDIPGVNGNGRYYCKDDGSYDFDPPWGEGSIDGGATYAEKINAINHVFSGLAIAVGT